VKVYLNNEAFILPQPSGLEDLLKLSGHSCQSLILLNGTSELENVPLKEGDKVFALKKGEIPNKALYASLWAVRYGEENFKKLQEARVAICGCGGLGSHIALSLARLGIGELLLIDKDEVDLTNLGRQAYFPEDLGKAKAHALKAQIERLTPLVKVKSEVLTLDESNIPTYLGNYPYIIEAFDQASAKAMLTETILSHYPDTTLIGASGMSGMDHPNKLTTKKVFSRYYLCGDGTSELEPPGLLAPRVMLCAAQQATILMHLILSKGD